MLGNANEPSLLDALSCDTPVALWTRTTVAPGTTAPVLSMTTPEMVEVTPPWPAAGAARNIERSSEETASSKHLATRVTLYQTPACLQWRDAKWGRMAINHGLTAI